MARWPHPPQQGREAWKFRWLTEGRGEEGLHLGGVGPDAISRPPGNSLVDDGTYGVCKRINFLRLAVLILAIPSRPSTTQQVRYCTVPYLTLSVAREGFGDRPLDTCELSRSSECGPHKPRKPFCSPPLGLKQNRVLGGVHVKATAERQARVNAARHYSRALVRGKVTACRGSV